MRISKRAAIRTYHPNFVYCLETVTVRGVFELLYLGGLCPTPFSVYRYIYTSTACRSIRILFVRCECSPGQKLGITFVKLIILQEYISIYIKM